MHTTDDLSASISISSSFSQIGPVTCIRIILLYCINSLPITSTKYPRRSTTYMQKDTRMLKADAK